MSQVETSVPTRCQVSSTLHIGILCNFSLVPDDPCIVLMSKGANPLTNSFKLIDNLIIFLWPVSFCGIWCLPC